MPQKNRWEFDSKKGIFLGYFKMRLNWLEVHKISVKVIVDVKLKMSA